MSLYRIDEPDPEPRPHRPAPSDAAAYRAVEPCPACDVAAWFERPCGACKSTGRAPGKDAA